MEEQFRKDGDGTEADGKRKRTGAGKVAGAEKGERADAGKGAEQAAGSGVQDGIVTMGAMQGMLRDFQASIVSTIDSRITASNQAIMEGWSQQIRRLEEKADGQHRTTREAIQEIEGRTRRLAEGHDALRTKIGKLDAAFVTVESGTPITSPRNSNFERTVDEKIVHIRSGTDVSKDATFRAVEEILREMQFERSWVQMEGRAEISKFHTLRFTGDEKTAAQRVRKFLELQRTATGWRQLEAATIGGDKTKIWVDGDKNKKTIKTEKATKKLAAILKEALPEERIHAKRKDGKVYGGRVPLARVSFQDEDSLILEWNRNANCLAKLNKDEVMAEIKKACRLSADDETEWG